MQVNMDGECVQPGVSSGPLSEEDEVSARKEEETVVKRHRLEGLKKKDLASQTKSVIVNVLQ